MAPCDWLKVANLSELEFLSKVRGGVKSMSQMSEHVGAMQKLLFKNMTRK